MKNPESGQNEVWLNLHIKMPKAVYETYPVEHPHYDNGDGTYKTFSDVHPGAVMSADGLSVAFPMLPKATDIDAFATLSSANGLTFSYGTDYAADVIIFMWDYDLGRPEIFSYFESPEWTGAV